MLFAYEQIKRRCKKQQLGGPLIVNERKTLPAIRVSLSTLQAGDRSASVLLAVYLKACHGSHRHGCNLLLCSYMPMLSRLAVFCFLFIYSTTGCVANLARPELGTVICSNTRHIRSTFFAFPD